MARLGVFLLALWDVIAWAAVLVGLAYAVVSALGITVIDLARLMGLELTEAGKVLLGTGILGAGMLAENIGLRLRLRRRSQKSGALLNAAKVRSEGIDLWTLGLSKLENADQAKAWIEEWKAWHKRAIKAANAIAPHEGEALSHLGGRGVHDFPEGRFFGKDHEQAVSIFIDQLGVLDEIRKRHARD